LAATVCERSRCPISARLANGSGQGTGLAPYNLGQTGGEEAHMLALPEMAAGPNSHAITAVNNATANGTNVPSSSVTLGAGYAGEAGSPVVNIYSSAAPTVPMSSLTSTGGQPHENRMPYLAINYCIALQGIFPSRS
jgi:microcystin-dependent protein